jgi:thiol-disulfide isomerase/thioredoxin
VLVVGYILGTRRQLSQVGKKKSTQMAIESLRPGVPAILYFWSEECAPCKTVQKPALERLQTELGPDGLQVIAVNALEQPTVADAWGVLGLPTTFVIDRQGQPRRVNHGVARAEHLREQIRLVG